MNRDRAYLEHVLDCLGRIERYVADGRESFMGSDLIQDGVLRRLHTLAESTQRISDTVKSAYPEVPWREISGFRNVVVHGYLAVDLDQIWHIVENDLPPLRAQVEAILSAVHEEDL